MPHHRSQSIEVKCIADKNMPSGVANCFLVTDPNDPEKTEFILTALRRIRIDLERDSHYVVTFRKIDPPK
jgi:hypothetical protein